MSTVDRSPEQRADQLHCPSCGRPHAAYSFALDRDVVRDHYHCAAGHGWITEWVLMAPSG